tara:strand:- start:4294 stop:4623 length:330 start_codon:yes stop_codon:yes gene_type:complete
MNKTLHYVCEPNNFSISLSISYNKIATVAIYSNEEPLCRRKFLMADGGAEKEEINELVAMFCDLFIENQLREQNFEGEMDGSEFIIQTARSSLRKTYNKLGLPVWHRRP